MFRSDKAAGPAWMYDGQSGTDGRGRVTMTLPGETEAGLQGCDHQMSDNGTVPFFLVSFPVSLLSASKKSDRL